MRRRRRNGSGEHNRARFIGTVSWIQAPQEKNKGWGYGGLKSSPVLAVKPVISRGRYCIRLRRVLTSAATWSVVRLVMLVRLRFRCDHTASIGFSSGA